MDIDKTVVEMFQSMKAKPVKASQRDTTDMDIKKIEHQMNNYLRLKQGRKFQKVSLTNPNPTNEGLDNAIDQEILRKFANKKWGSLPLFMKWNLLQTYFKDNEIQDENWLKDLKRSLQTSKESTSILYDHAQQKITNINRTLAD